MPTEPQRKGGFRATLKKLLGRSPEQPRTEPARQPLQGWTSDPIPVHPNSFTMGTAIDAPRDSANPDLHPHDARLERGRSRLTG